MGVLDDIMRTVAHELIDVFVDNKRNFKSETTAYNPVAGVQPTPTVTIVQIKTSPVSDPTIEQVTGGNPVRVKHSITVAAVDAEEVSFDLSISSTRKIFVEVDGRWVRVSAFHPIYSGDQRAAYILELDM